MKNSFKESNIFKMLLSTSVILTMVACASQQAGKNAGDSRLELSSYVGDVNTRIAENERARFILEKTLLKIDIKNKIVAGENPEAVATFAADKTEELISNKNKRIAQFLGSTAKAIKADTLMGSVQGYNTNGITLEQLQTTLTDLSTLLISEGATVNANK